ncbi:alpha-(1,3)-fucosyltransferase 10 [Macrobrachium rosenbergii]|uniref:alpha-(1,3)-fucosyltransferase 10 n=1 Tax=Macrobrachium rosenbergii TaxID=79674 RepID=UPI0034D63C22
MIMCVKRYYLLITLYMCNFFLVSCYLDENKDAGPVDNLATPPNVDSQGEENVVLWWTPFTGIQGQSRTCSVGTCFFTENRNVVNEKTTKAVLFYGSDFNVEDLPLPRPLSQWWGVLHEESPKNQPLFDHDPVLKLFNVTSTFRRNSSFPLTLQHLVSIDILTSTDEYFTLTEKTLFSERDDLAPIIYVQSDCDTPAERDNFVQELSKLIKIDSYGRCLHNRDLPLHLQDAAATYDHTDFRKLVSKYKFALAIENAACDDYITEKLWRPLSVGTIPIYWGSPSIIDWVPNPKSIIHIRDFDSPVELAQYLYAVLQNDTLYESFLEHKEKGMVSNTNLIKSMDDRKWGINNDFERGNFIEHFECHVCDEILRGFNSQRKQADSSHYGCPEPPSVLTGQPNPKSFWVEEWHKARVEAQVLHRFVSTKPGVFTSDQFFQEVIDRLQKDGFFSRFLHVHEDL